MNIKELISTKIKLLPNVDQPKHEIEILLSYVSHYSRIFILTHNDIILSKLQMCQLNDLIYRRAQGEPIAYLLGQKEFWSLSLHVSYDTLIPRPDTEILVEQALLKIKKNSFMVLDLGSGCGAIALAIASTCKNCQVFGVDQSKKAIKISQLNACQLNIKNASFFYSNWFSNIYKKFDIIVSNPPYISEYEMQNLDKDIFFEPMQALVSKNNGFSDIQHIVKYAKNHLNNGGWLLIEHGWKQKKTVHDFFFKYKFKYVESFKDYGGHYRVTIGQKISV